MCIAGLLCIHNHKVGSEVQMLRLALWTVDGEAGTAAVIRRAFTSQTRAYLRSLVEVGVCGLHAMAWELTSGGSGVATSASGFHRERGVALNRWACSWLEG